MTNCLMPALRESKCMRGGPVVLSVLSGGVHGPYKEYKTDPELKNNYSIKNAADFAGFYNDLVLDRMAEKNPSTNFVHASPGFVASNWGTEMPAYLRYPIRCLVCLLDAQPIRSLHLTRYRSTLKIHAAFWNVD